MQMPLGSVFVGGAQISSCTSSMKKSVHCSQSMTSMTSRSASLAMSSTESALESSSTRACKLSRCLSKEIRRKMHSRILRSVGNADCCRASALARSKWSNNSSPSRLALVNWTTDQEPPLEPTLSLPVLHGEGDQSGTQMVGIFVGDEFRRPALGSVVCCSYLGSLYTSRTQSTRPSEPLTDSPMPNLSTGARVPLAWPLLFRTSSFLPAS
mmetsp:Transcript_121666/g.315743  ORF Transcript_121666/g.315743 Transcript_121666/m.315743 type:complete len:211 (+) Transcript_121666:478-1110(+)